MRKFHSEEWGLLYEEHKAPLWLIIGVTKDDEIHIGFWQSETKEEALAGANKDLDILYEVAIDMFSAMSEASMFQDVESIIDRVDNA